jgi:malate dehydrogenase (oxaloacetate-decarboxylating)
MRPIIPDYDIIFIIKSLHKSGELGHLLSVIGQEGGLIGDIKTKYIGKTDSIREITISVYDYEHQIVIENSIKNKTNAEIIEIKDIVFEKHINGKIHSKRKENIENISDLRYIYTPGVGRICKAIKENQENFRKYTNVSNSVGIFTNGTRVLGYGDIGVYASMPVMEGKAVIYDLFVDISATPILVDTKDPDKFIETVLTIAPTFGGIHLEDIRIPDCFYIETELIKKLKKPVMHDDQHGTATVVLAAIISALRETGKNKNDNLSVAQIGLGAAGFGIAKLLMDYGLNVTGVDPNEQSQKRLIDYGGKIKLLEEAIKEADIVVATTGVVGLIKKEMIKKGQIILSLSNPVPEIFPEQALDAGASFASDGKSVNNALAYPGLFKAALEINALEINSKMKIAAAEAISSLADKNELVHKKVIEAVKKTVN